MKFREKLSFFIVIFVILMIIVNMGAINNFLSMHTDKTIQFGHSSYVVPDSWNTTDEVNMTANAKTKTGMTNNYTVLDVWDDWPEDHMGSISHSKLASMEKGGYQTVKSEIISLGGKNVTREYFSNPSRDTETQWDHMGVVYIFSKEDTNYAVEVHYFTSNDYNNTSYTKELDDCVEYMMSNMHNNNYNWLFSEMNKLVKSIDHLIS